ncbi:MAG: hypothetical protein AAF170_00690 [Bacteroidota bacterium]
MIQEDELDAFFPERVGDEVWIELCGRVPRPGFHSASITQLRQWFERWKVDGQQLTIAGRKSFWDAKVDSLTKLVEAEQVTCDIHEDFLHGNIQDLLDDVEAERGLATTALRHDTSKQTKARRDYRSRYMNDYEWMARRYDQFVKDGKKTTAAMDAVIEVYQQEKGEEHRAKWGVFPDTLSRTTIQNAINAMKARTGR